MLIISVEDINPDDSLCVQLAIIASKVGIMDMRQAYMLIEPYMDSDGQTAMLMVGPDNHQEIKRLFLAMAIFNYACFVHENFSIPAMEENMARKLGRQHSVFEYEAKISVYLNTFFDLVDKYGM